MNIVRRIFGGILIFSLAVVDSRAAERQNLRGHVPPVIQGLQPIGQLSGSTNLQLAVGLPLRNPERLTNLLADIYDSSSRNFRHYLTPGQFAREFGPAEADYQAVMAFAKANALQVTATHPNRVIVDVSGSVADVERAFHVTIGVYQHPTEHRTFYAPDREPSVDLAVPILKISGLDNYSVPRPRLKSIALVNAAKALPWSGSGPQGTYMGNDFRTAYVPGTILTGAGQSVGLLQFDGYSASDISNYEATAGLPSVTLSNVLIDGATGQPSGSGGQVEVSLDIETAISMAPGLSQVILYMAPNPSPFVDILNRMVTDNTARQLSCSWYSPNSGPDPVADQIFQEMAAQGQSFMNASGDNDAWTGFIPFPGETPYITQVGGTTLTTASPGGGWVSETVWNRYNGIGSGGGISTNYAIPSWQTNVSMANNQGSGTMRNLPDVALTAENVYVRSGGADYAVGGTSCAAPLWAGFMALVNQQAANYSNTPVGFINPALYQIGASGGYLSAFHDITTGDNTSTTSPNQFFAVAGYDLCTGLGTPAGQGLIDALAFPPASTPPTILEQPQDQTAPTASNVVMVVTATGSPILQYQWSLNGTNIDGATNALLLLPNVQPSQAGNYSVQITNAFGSVTSSNALLTVEPPIPPGIVVQPQDQIVAPGGIALFNVMVTGTPPTFQWTFEGNAVSGATNSSLVLFDVDPTNAGIYAVLVTNAGGWTASSNAALTVVPPGTSCESNFDGLVGWWAGENDAYNAVDGTFSQLDGGIGFVPGEIGQAFSFNGTSADVQIAPSKALNVGLTNGFTIEAWINPSDVSRAHPLAEWGHPLVPENGLMLWISIPNGYGGNGPGSLVLDIGDIGTGELATPPGFIRSNVWQHVAATYDKTSGIAAVYVNGSLIIQTNFGLISAWTSESLWFGYDPVSTAWGPSVYGEQYHYAGQMDEVLVYNRALSAAEIQATYNAAGGLCVLPTMAVTIQPTNQTALTGTTATFQAIANGTEPLYFQWSFNGTNISGATSATLALTNVQIDQSGTYAVQASNLLGSILSSNATLLVSNAVAPAITLQPTNETAAAGNSTTFRLIATGTPPLCYQWNVNGTNISQATNASLTLSNITFANEGVYSASVTNIAGSVVSSNVALTVYPGWNSSGAGTSSWSCVASSADGKKLVAGIYGGTIYRSVDAGAAWIATSAPTNNWWSIASSSDGNTLAAAQSGLSGSIYCSTNGGLDWAKSGAPSGNWRGIACSSDGRKLVAAMSLNAIYVSTNAGSTWTHNSVSNQWSGVASSADGVRLVAVTPAGFNSTGIYVSTNSAAGWRQLTNGPTYQDWSAVASSADGTKLVVTAGGFSGGQFIVAHNGPIFVSTNSGASWVQAANAPITAWQSVACSADGSRLVAVAGGAPGLQSTAGGQIYISADGGVTWRNSGAPGNWWFSVASSADGNQFAAAFAGSISVGQIYIWQSSPTLGFAPSENGLTLLWPRDWTGYVLQENPDLSSSNWTDVPIPAVLTNGQNQVLLSPTNGRNFYRLEFP